MSDTNVITREQFESMTPETYPTGKATGALGTVWATAGAVQLEAVNPREVNVMMTAMQQVAPLHQENTTGERYRNSVEESAEVSYGVLGSPVDPKLVDWLKRFEPVLKSANDLNELVNHLSAVARQHAMFAGLRETRPA
jgi:hypothetical protein